LEVEFDLNTLRLQSKKAESVIWEKKLVEGSHRSSMYGVILAHSLEEVETKTKALKALSSVSEVQSVRSLLPSDQEQKVGLLRQIKPFLAEQGHLLVCSNLWIRRSWTRFLAGSVSRCSIQAPLNGA